MKKCLNFGSFDLSTSSTFSTFLLVTLMYLGWVVQSPIKVTQVSDNFALNSV